MSLVVCSNKDSDGTERQKQSIYKAWSFRNSLSSAYTVPANSQVALQSCKVNIDGRMVFSRNNHRFYHYMGQKVATETPAPAGQALAIADTTSHPCITTLTTDSEQGRVIEMSVDDFAARVQQQVRSTTYHPNAKEQFTCDVLRNASSVDFLGYSLKSIQNVSVPTFAPATGSFEQWYRDDDEYAPTAPATFTYIGGVFKRESSNNILTTAVGICPSRPLSLTEGELKVNISTASANANASGVEWHVGLSRFINEVTESGGYYYPDYYDYGKDTNIRTSEECHMDFAVCRNQDGELVVYQSAYDPVHECTRRYEVEYWNNPEADGTFTKAPLGRFSMDGTSFDYVKFKVDGEQVSLVINIVGTGEATLVDYSAAADKKYMFKPVNQACWCLHPVLMVGVTTANQESTLELANFGGMNITDYNPKIINKGGWFETLELTAAGTFRALSVEERTWNQPTEGTAYAQIKTGTAPNNGVNYSFVYILEPSDVYKPTFGANARQLLGFNNAILQNPNSLVAPNGGIYNSVFTPSRVSSYAMFVKLNNFGQKVVNARTGFESKILSHLTDLETLSGRQTYEPNNLIWLDLDNPADMNVNEFDISFVYANEQYATILTGQSIVCLYFRKKPKELM